MEIKIKKDSYGRYYAEYSNPLDRFLNGIGQYGSTAFEAKLNLKVLLSIIEKQRLKTTVIRSI